MAREEVHAVLANDRLDARVVGADDVDLDVVAVPDLVDQRVGFLRQASRVDREDPNVAPDFRGEVEDHHRLGLEGARDRDAGMELVECPAEDLLSRGSVEPGQVLNSDGQQRPPRDERFPYLLGENPGYAAPSSEVREKL